LLEAQIPYSDAALNAYLTFPGPHSVVASTARDLAGRAYKRARAFTPDGLPCLGLGITAALATDRQRRGADRAHIALRSADQYCCCELVLDKTKDRLEQERVLSRFALEFLGRHCGADSEFCLPAWTTATEHVIDLQDPLDLLLRGVIEVVEVDEEGIVRVDVERGERLLYSGSFNPLHEGHEKLAAAAARLSGRKVALEISIENVDKPPLQRTELMRRLAQARGRFAVCLTREPTFYGKARHFADVHFVIGYDTVVRLVDGRYYEGGEMEMERALGELLARGCRFWVAGRQVEGHYRTLEDAAVPSALLGLFCAIPEAQFRVDLSSTEIRSRRDAEKPS